MLLGWIFVAFVFGHIEGLNQLAAGIAVADDGVEGYPRSAAT
jgi:hypothetical protein